MPFSPHGFLRTYPVRRFPVFSPLVRSPLLAGRGALRLAGIPFGRSFDFQGAWAASLPSTTPCTVKRRFGSLFLCKISVNGQTTLIIPCTLQTPFARNEFFSHYSIAHSKCRLSHLIENFFSLFYWELHAPFGRNKFHHLIRN